MCRGTIWIWLHTCQMGWSMRSYINRINACVTENKILIYCVCFWRIIYCELLYTNHILLNVFSSSKPMKLILSTSPSKWGVTLWFFIFESPHLCGNCTDPIAFKMNIKVQTRLRHKLGQKQKITPTLYKEYNYSINKRLSFVKKEMNKIIHVELQPIKIIHLIMKYK